MLRDAPYIPAPATIDNAPTFVLQGVCIWHPPPSPPIVALFLHPDSPMAGGISIPVPYGRNHFPLLMGSSSKEEEREAFLGGGKL